MDFIPVSTYKPSKSWIFTYHMYAYLVQITVVKYDAQPSNNLNYFKIVNVFMIMQRGLLKDFIIKYNHNNMVEIQKCL